MQYVTNGRSEVFNGIDIAVRARFGNGGLLDGGVSTGSTHLDNLGDAAVHNCSPSTDAALMAYYGNGNAQQRVFCVTDNRQDPFKVNASYPLLWGISAAAVYQNIPGTNQLAVPIISPNSQRENRASQLDARFRKTFKFGDRSIRAGFDIYNLLNSSDVLTINQTYGPIWLKPGAVLPARLSTPPAMLLG
jgi:hypothetical protein